MLKDWWTVWKCFWFGPNDGEVLAAPCDITGPFDSGLVKGGANPPPLEIIESFLTNEVDLFMTQNGYSNEFDVTTRWIEREEIFGGWTERRTTYTASTLKAALELANKED